MEEREALAARALELYHEAFRSLAAGRGHIWAGVDLTLAQIKVLFVLRERETATVSQLAAELERTMANVTGLLDRLVQQGLVQREDDPHDRRLVISRLTPGGQDLVDRLQEGRRAQMQAVFARLSADDLAALARGLAAVRDATRAAPVAGTGNMEHGTRDE